jgi:uncharacterized LabA/DUF88 family protein
MDMEQRIAILVDVQNMFYSAKNLKQAKVDYGCLLKQIVGDRHLIRAIAYILQKENIDQSSFHDALSKFGYELKIKELKVRTDHEGKTTISRDSWSVGLTIDAIRLANKVDTIVLVTGDGEYVYLVETLKSIGCRVEIVSFDRSTAGELIKAANQYTPIQDSWIFKEKKFEKPDEKRIDVEEEQNDSIGLLGSTAAGKTIIDGLPRDDDDIDDLDEVDVEVSKTDKNKSNKFGIFG